MRPDALTRLAQGSTRVMLESKEILYHPDERISHIYFPETAVIAMLTMMENGASIESATVGREGASWVSASLSSPSMPCQTMVAVTGMAFRVPAHLVEAEIKENGAFHNTLTAYSHALLIQTLRSTACNGLHSIEQRAARWMLTTLDRTDTGEFEITHEFFGMLLGVRRASISTMVEALVSRDILDVSRGTIRVYNRPQLEKVSCECYSVIREAYAAFDRATARS
jgi:CRP-like cAMP-binding protein